MQGAAAALLTPARLAIVGAAYEGETRGPAIGTWAAAAALTTALGPPLGGWLVDTVGWRSIFFINPPIAVAALLLALKLPPDRGAEAAEPLDWSGSVLALLALGLLSYGLIALGAGNWTMGALALAAAAFVLLSRTGGRLLRGGKRAYGRERGCGPGHTDPRIRDPGCAIA